MSSTALNTDVNMQGVDTIIAIPQWYVNFNLAQILATGKTKGGGSLKDIALNIGTNTWIRATIDSLATKFQVAGSVTKVKFIISFASGTMDYYDISKTPPAKESADIAGLSFGFQVDLSFKDLANNQDIPDYVKQQIEKRMSNLGAGAYTIQQFFMDLTEGAVSTPDPTVTVYPANFPASAKAALPNYMATYVNELTQVGGHVLGYGVEVQNPGGAADPVASFPPTKLNFVTNQYEAPSPAAGTDNSDLDTINYLMMTGVDPSFPQNLKPWWGNFIRPGDDASGVDGVSAVRSELILSKFLIEKLSPIVCTYVEVDDRSDNISMKTVEKVGKLTPTTLGGTFSKKNIKGKSHKTNAVSNDDAVYTFSFDVDLKINPGTNTITIKRVTKFSTQVTHWYGIEHHALKSQFEVDYEIPVTYTIKLEGVSDGALQVNVTQETKEPDPNTAYGDPYGWLITGTKGEWTVWKSVSDTWDSVISDAVGIAVPDAVPADTKKKIADSLNLLPFVFPGGAQLFMKDPMFSGTGDLLVGLQYKG
jgi:hypothetical protein